MQSMAGAFINAAEGQYQQATMSVEEQRRAPSCRAGRLVYQAELDQDKLECLYGWLKCMCCSKQVMANRSFVDVYTNGLMTNVPTGCLCCCWIDNIKFILWDDVRFSTGMSVGQAGFCKPFPWCCPHCFGLCGDAIYTHRPCVCGCCFSSCALGIGHMAMCAYWGCCFGCCVTDLICGMKEGEGAKLEQVMNAARQGNAQPMIRAPVGMGNMVAQARLPGAPSMPIMGRHIQGVNDKDAGL